LDLEMTIDEHYDEVMDVFSDLFIYIFDGLNERCKSELERVREQHPFEDLKYLRPTLKLTYAEGCALLREAGIDQVCCLRIVAMLRNSCSCRFWN
jgi:aspartyl/asparaginyl-tRNA synthetase